MGREHGWSRAVARALWTCFQAEDTAQGQSQVPSGPGLISAWEQRWAVQTGVVSAACCLGPQAFNSYPTPTPGTGRVNEEHSPCKMFSERIQTHSLFSRGGPARHMPGITCRLVGTISHCRHAAPSPLTSPHLVCYLPDLCGQPGGGQLLRGSRAQVPGRYVPPHNSISYLLLTKTAIAQCHF